MSGTSQHRQSRVFRERRIGGRALAEIEDGAAVRFDSPHELAVGAKADAAGKRVWQAPAHTDRIMPRARPGDPQPVYANLNFFCDWEEKFMQF
jgi:hypothetical protein